jgi:hypothetical protein
VRHYFARRALQVKARCALARVFGISRNILSETLSRLDVWRATGAALLAPKRAAAERR